MKQKVLVFIPTIGGGGAERIVANIINHLDKNKYAVTLLLLKETDESYSLNKEINVQYLNKNSLKSSIPALIKYLKRNPPDIMISNMSLSNISAIIARMLVRLKFPLIIVEHSTISIKYQNDKLSRRFIPKLMRMFYKYADKIICVSQDSLSDLKKVTRVDEDKLIQIYNPVVDANLNLMKNKNIEHTWFNNSKIKVIIGIGRLEEVKNFNLLIESFYIALAENKNLRLMILGDGSLKEKLKNKVISLNIEKYVEFMGFITNPYAYLGRSSLFVLSSNLEGLPTVLIEALACGVKVVATDCPSGPREILNNGEYGKLVPVGNENLLAKAILEQIESNIDKDLLIKRATFFSVDKSVFEYEKVIDSFK